MYMNINNTLTVSILPFRIAGLVMKCFEKVVNRAKEVEIYKTNPSILDKDRAVSKAFLNESIGNVIYKLILRMSCGASGPYHVLV